MKLVAEIALSQFRIERKVLFEKAKRKKYENIDDELSALDTVLFKFLNDCVAQLWKVFPDYFLTLRNSENFCFFYMKLPAGEGSQGIINESLILSTVTRDKYGIAKSIQNEEFMRSIKNRIHDHFKENQHLLHRLTSDTPSLKSKRLYDLFIPRSLNYHTGYSDTHYIFPNAERKQHIDGLNELSQTMKHRFLEMLENHNRQVATGQIEPLESSTKNMDCEMVQFFINFMFKEKPYGSLTIRKH